MPLTKEKQLRELSLSYRDALKQHLRQDGSDYLASASNLGQGAVAQGLDTLDLAILHEQALVEFIIPTDTAAIRKNVLRLAKIFFDEVMLPIEATHRGATNSNIASVKVNSLLKAESLKCQFLQQLLRKKELQAHELVSQSQHMQEKMRQMTHLVLSAQEDERKRVSHDLHDVIAQVLTGINVQLAVLKSEAEINSKGIFQNIARAQKLVAKSVNIVHQFAYNLRPAMLDNLGLVPAIQLFIRKFIRKSGLQVTFKTDISEEQLSTTQRTVLYRVLQESLNNVHNHAECSLVEVSLEESQNALQLKIHDNGKSFNVTKILQDKRNRRMGLFSMKERTEMIGGHFVIASSPGKGTTVYATLPIPQSKSPTP